MDDSRLFALLASGAFVDRWLEDQPESVDPALRAAFEQLAGNGANAAPPGPAASPAILTARGALPEGVRQAISDPGLQIYDLVHSYREFGHLAADLDPLGQTSRRHPFLELEQFGLSQADLSKRVSCRNFHGLDAGTIAEYVAWLRETYCGPIGVEYMDVLDSEQRDWLQKRMEPLKNRPKLTRAQERAILTDLVAADLFEETLGKMYPGTKRFSLEGSTSLVTLLKIMVEDGAEAGVADMVFGMAHRGRLNMLAHVLGKPLEFILAEFEGRPQASEVQGYGDVKYHLGYSYDHVSASGKNIHLSLAFNPSHLETVNPVVEGIVRAKQERQQDGERTRICPVLIHGDAAFAGQGVVAETLTLANITGYETGGTIHVIVNNQVGFTADPRETRSTRYASDWAKSVRAPVFHVNADHPEAVHLVGQLAIAYRQRFHRDVVVDLICFRRHGHNEMDDASFTQPRMTKLIASHASVSTIYGNKLAQDEIVTPADIEEMRTGVRTRMETAREKARGMPAQVSQRLGGAWQGLTPATADWSADTRITGESIQTIADALVKVPSGFQFHPRLEKLMEKRRDLIKAGQALDWGAGEALAYGSLLLEGTAVRLSGQDAGRGTFSHRHSIYSDHETGQRYVPLNHLGPKQAHFEVLNSPLSEEAVLGFEYGYSSADPWTLVVWEAQFGDFCNGAQVMVDQLIASAEYKWGRMSGLVMLLPHGYEGQGPEHSSARLERFLELCAENNMQVANPTTPAQIFHILRRQMRRSFRKPLVVMSPKSLLRAPEAVSPIADFTNGTFQNVIGDSEVTPADVKRVLLCSGKIYYALAAGRRERGRNDTAILRLEQLYPYPARELETLLGNYPNMKRLVWVQEEPRNMGAWRNLLHRFEDSTPRGAELSYIGRDSRAVPATGSYEIHLLEEADLVQAAFSDGSREHVVRRGRAAAEQRAKQERISGI